MSKPILRWPTRSHLASAGFLVGDDDVLGGQLDPPAELRVRFVGKVSYFARGRVRRQHEAACDVTHRAVAGDAEPLDAGEALLPCAVEIVEVLLGPLSRQGDLRLFCFAGP